VQEEPMIAMAKQAGLVLAFALCAASAHASVEISTAATQNMSCNAGVCSPTAKKATLNVAELANMLAAGDVTIKSDSLSQDVDIDAAMSWTSGSRLTLDAYRSITFNKPAVVAGTGALTIATNDGGSGGDFRFLGKGHVEFWDTKSNLIINGMHYFLVRGLKDAEHEVRNNPSGLFALARNVNARGRGTYGAAPISTIIDGTFEGLGNAVSNLSVNNTEQHGVGVGLFATLYFNGTIRDVRVVNASIQGSVEGQYLGALVGGAGGTVLNCSATGQVTGTGSKANVGGLVGGTDGTIRRSYSSVTVSASSQASSSGGLVGLLLEDDPNHPALVAESYTMGSVTSGDGVPAGGLVGVNSGSVISNSSSRTSVSGGSSAFVGGLVGSLDVGIAGVNPSIAAAYSTGAVSGGSGALIGGLIGKDTAGTGIVNAYWDLDTSGVSDPSQGAGNVANDPGITGLTTAQFQSGLPVGFDKKIWKEKATVNGGYPYLIANPPQ
jgi:hypothetical protein